MVAKKLKKLKKTTLNIDETVMRRLKEEAVRRGQTMSSLVEAAICSLLDAPKAKERPALPPLPSWNLGDIPFDVADREAMYDFLDGERMERLHGIPRRKS